MLLPGATRLQMRKSGSFVSEREICVGKLAAGSMTIGNNQNTSLLLVSVRLI